MMKLYKNIYSAWITRTSPEIFFSQIDVVNVSKIQEIYCYFMDDTSMDFQKVSMESAATDIQPQELDSTRGWNQPQLESNRRNSS